MSGSAELGIRDLRIINNEPCVLDLRVAERLEFKSPPQIRELIERNRSELERYGSLSYHTKYPGAQGGRPATEFLLNEAQALLVCMKSDAPRAADVRQEVITVFLAWRHGKIAPQRGGSISIEVIGDLFQTVQRDVAETKDNVVYIREGIDRANNRIDDIVPRRDFSRQTRRLWLFGVQQRYDGGCPCGCGILIVRGGLPIEGVWTDDHWYSRERNGSSEGWPVSWKCNQLLRDPNYRESKLPEFQFFHKNLEWLTSKAITITHESQQQFEMPEHFEWKQEKLL